MSAAGGEQKKRSVIMPTCAGLSPSGYVMPKFIVYPLAIVLMSFIGGMITGGISNLIYNNELIISDIVFSSVCSAIYMFFITAVYFLAGLSTGRPGISVIIVYAGSTIVPLILQALNMNNFVLSMVVTVVLSVISCLLTLMITTLRKIDNSVGEANL